MARDRGGLVGLLLCTAIVVVAVVGPWVVRSDPLRVNLERAFASPGTFGLFGADHLGRDLAARLVWGARTSLLSGAGALAIGLAVGVPTGLVAGYRRGTVDEVVMALLEVLMAFPGILLAILAVAVLGASRTTVVVAVGLVSAPLLARVVRGTTLALREAEYVLAARALGVGERRILWRHILPGCLSPLIVLSVLRLGTAIVTVAGLGFLGLGGDPAVPEWGAMLSEGLGYLRRAPHLALLPGVAILLTVLSVNLFGDALNDALNPRLRLRAGPPPW
ncbi:MAG: ABC transporter permease [Armatimonadota bacterium]|nr:ABC transporter permease [Armatimonadota bacterium]MDR7449847.1 ABC transporter permease [Armatimonadota bacterium]MDR7459127.1 ABC transporter permease [Armatimonadota bacterium]MDR7480401.1 ABC transporter permease [Armatimonadota bacterium]MDR7489411.1 ABC transporter permease [Armatimonadota bacterium]